MGWLDGAKGLLFGMKPSEANPGEDRDMAQRNEGWMERKIEQQQEQLDHQREEIVTDRLDDALGNGGWGNGGDEGGGW